ncbi:metallophosphoesterase family protein [Autumnicola musiva]|uniref:Metallophosphoesterase family protein n=1 Tax=Autumnicola musiva TaxID=3075589 RepID=A0ABU3DAJ2_9FLAO|nr:metallophosphoesterase family protein [Zunongwangia sp. F117]MDT0678550.1 metallophosphoesterase family protein [Zunongwangia sp. F117]
MKYSQKLIGLFFIIFLVKYSYSQTPRVYKAPEYEEEWSKPTNHPDRIIINPGVDPSTTMSITWRTSIDIKEGFAEIAKATAAPKFWRTANTIDAKTETLNAENVEKAGVIANYHSVTFTKLEPGTLYGYRVGDGKHWSEWIQFKTAASTPEKFSFLYVGDAQNYILELWSRLIREGYRMAPEASFIIHAGDLINNAHNDEQWHEWFQAGGWIHSMLPSLSVPGNHEYGAIEEGGDKTLSVQWKPQFTLPNNGPEGLEETAYYIDYQGARIIGLNSLDWRKWETQAEWLEKVLKNNPNQWTVVSYHYPLFSASEGRDNKRWREHLKPLFDKYGVDLALQGHDHSYARGRVAPAEYNLVSGLNKRDQTGTVYVVSVSGGKMYSLKSNGWDDYEAERDRAAENTQLFQIVSVDGDELTFESYTATGDLYDAFSLTKNANGPNTFKEMKDGAISERYHHNTISYEDTLPLDVQREVLSKYSGYTVDRVNASEDSGEIYYGVRLRKGDTTIKLRVDEKGNVLEEEK